jgi:hypothetical protein
MPVVIDNKSETNQDQLQVNQQQVTDPLALTVTTGSNTNRLPENCKVIDQRHAISKFIADGLRQLIVNQSNDTSTKIMGSLNISNSLIHIDLAALGITSLSIPVIIPDQSDASLVTSPMSAQLTLQNSDVQIHPNLQGPTADSMDKGSQITKVYYRKRFKNKSGIYDKQTTKKTFTKQLITRRTTTITKVYYRRKSKSRIREAAQQSVHEDNVFADFCVGYVPVDLQLTINEKRCSKCVSRRRKSNAPVSTLMLRRSLRLKDKLDGHKPESASSSKRPVTRNKLKGKKVAAQPDLLNNILLSPLCQENEFPGLSDITKYNDFGAIFPEIPVQEIQKVATEKCRIAPSEVTAELLLASRPNEASSSGRSAKDMHLVTNG